jgi:hypothetical protein
MNVRVCIQLKPPTASPPSQGPAGCAERRVVEDEPEALATIRVHPSLTLPARFGHNFRVRVLDTMFVRLASCEGKGKGLHQARN